MFNVAPQDTNRTLTQDQAKGMLKGNGINTSQLTEDRFAAFARLSTAGQQRSIQAYAESLARREQSQRDEGMESSDNPKTEETPPANSDGVRENWSASDEELIYKTVKRTKRDPISIELDQNESKAAKAAMG